MTPKEKAKELYDKMYSINIDEFISIHASKNAALIAVDEILKCNLETSVSSNPHIEFNSKLINQYQWWQEVKQEIEKL
jgi:hypothetical protein